MSTYGHTSNLAIHPVGVELAERLIALSRPTGPGVLLQLRHRGQRGRVQSRPPDRQSRSPRRRGFLPRPHHGCLSLTGQPAKREPFEPLVPGVQFYEYGDLPEPGPDVRRDHRRADPGGGGCHPAARGLPGGPGPSWRPADRRRGADRYRSHRDVVRLPARWHRPGHGHAGQGPGRRAADRCAAHLRRRRRLAGPGPPRLHVRRQPRGVRRSAGGARRDRVAGPASGTSRRWGSGSQRPSPRLPGRRGARTRAHARCCPGSAGRQDRRGALPAGGGAGQRDR